MRASISFAPGLGGRRAGCLRGQSFQRQQSAIVAQPLAQPLELDRRDQPASGDELHQA